MHQLRSKLAGRGHLPFHVVIFRLLVKARLPLACISQSSAQFSWSHLHVQTDRADQGTQQHLVIAW